MSKHTPGQWIVATSNSWRRIQSADGEMVCEPIKQNDGHPDLYFRNGGFDGPDARLMIAAPDLLAATRFCLSVLKANMPVEMSEFLAIEKAKAAIALATGKDTPS